MNINRERLRILDAIHDGSVLLTPTNAVILRSNERLQLRCDRVVKAMLKAELVWFDSPHARYRLTDAGVHARVEARQRIDSEQVAESVQR